MITSVPSSTCSRSVPMPTTAGMSRVRAIIALCAARVPPIVSTPSTSSGSRPTAKLGVSSRNRSTAGSSGTSRQASRPSWRSARTRNRMSWRSASRSTTMWCAESRKRKRNSSSRQSKARSAARKFSRMYETVPSTSSGSSSISSCGSKIFAWFSPTSSAVTRRSSAICWQARSRATSKRAISCSTSSGPIVRCGTGGTSHATQRAVPRALPGAAGTPTSRRLTTYLLRPRDPSRARGRRSRAAPGPAGRLAPPPHLHRPRGCGSPRPARPPTSSHP